MILKRLIRRMIAATVRAINESNHCEIMRVPR